MEFISHIKISRELQNLDEATRNRIITEEREVAARLRSEHRMQRMWRDPARMANWILWHLKDATELHEIIAAMPAYPWFEDVEIITLAGHPVDPLSYELSDFSKSSVTSVVPRENAT